VNGFKNLIVAVLAIMAAVVAYIGVRGLSPTKAAILLGLAFSAGAFGFALILNRSHKVSVFTKVKGHWLFKWSIIVSLIWLGCMYVRYEMNKRKYQTFLHSIVQGNAYQTSKGPIHKLEPVDITPTMPLHIPQEHEKWQLTWWVTPQTKIKYKNAVKSSVHKARVTNFDPVLQILDFDFESKYSRGPQGRAVFHGRYSSDDNIVYGQWYNTIKPNEKGNYYVKPHASEIGKEKPRRFVGGFTMDPALTNGFYEFELIYTDLLLPN
jgi:hypothetical protein